jgi:hypothetical protein
MNTKEYNEALIEKIILGLEISHKKMLETKKRNNEELVIMQDNKIVSINLGSYTEYEKIMNKFYVKSN